MGSAASISGFTGASRPAHTRASCSARLNVGVKLPLEGSNLDYLIQRGADKIESSDNVLLIREFASFVAGMKDRNVVPCRTSRRQKRSQCRFEKRHQAGRVQNGSHRMEYRAIGLDVVTRVVEGPEQRLPVRPGRDVFQSKPLLGDPPQEYLVRMFVDVDRKPAEVVTVYRTTRIAKYWRAEK